jgi:hypothetical protein
VVAGLNKLHAIGKNSINDAVFKRESPAPAAGEFMAQRLGLSYPGEWVRENCGHQVQKSKRSFAVRLDPIPQIASKIA